MKILIEATQQAAHITGTDRVAHNTLVELQKLDKNNQYYIICTRGFDYVASAVTNPNFKIVRRRIYRRYQKILALPIKAMQGLYWKYINKPDIYFSFHNFSAPRIKSSIVIASAYDLIPMILREEYSKDSAAYKYYVSRLSNAARKSDHFVAISKYTKEDVMNYLDIKSEKITVIDLGVEKRFKPDFDKSTIDKVRKRYSLPKSFILTIGANEPRKNVEMLVEVFDSLPLQVQKANPLFILGAKWGKSSVDKRLPAHVHNTGFVSDEDLPVVYSMAKVFVFPSKYEGFGLPVLEAMACGAPVIASSATSVPEATGSAGISFDPANKQELKNAVAQVVGDEALRAKMTKAGLARARRFTWERTAQQLKKVFDEQMNEHSN